jgi:hypothetical protein
MEVSNSGGTPSIEDEELVICSGVARALDKYFSPTADERAICCSKEGGRGGAWIWVKR